MCGTSKVKYILAYKIQKYLIVKFFPLNFSEEEAVVAGHQVGGQTSREAYSLNLVTGYLSFFGPKFSSAILSCFCLFMTSQVLEQAA